MMQDTRDPLPTLLKPKLVLLTGHSCPTCRQVFIHNGATIQGSHDPETSYKMAQMCCGPWICRDCGKIEVKYRYGSCSDCTETKEQKAWDNTPIAPDQGYMVYANGDWYTSLDDYLESCFQDEVDPVVGRPTWGEPYKLEPPNLADMHEEDADEDGELPDVVAEAQEAVNKIYATQTGVRYSPNMKTRPDPATLILEEES